MTLNRQNHILAFAEALRNTDSESLENALQTYDHADTQLTMEDREEIERLWDLNPVEFKRVKQKCQSRKDADEEESMETVLRTEFDQEAEAREV